MKIFIISIAVLCNILLLFVKWVIPFRYVKRTGKFFYGVLLCWLLGILAIFLISVVIPGGLLAALPNYKDIILRSFPEAIGVAPYLLLGWIEGLIVCGIAFYFHKKTKSLPKTQKK